jgi:hypothetical protein
MEAQQLRAHMGPGYEAQRREMRYEHERIMAELRQTTLESNIARNAIEASLWQHQR